jgi:hypothetical protein
VSDLQARQVMAHRVRNLRVGVRDLNDSRRRCAWSCSTQ